MNTEVPQCRLSLSFKAHPKGSAGCGSCCGLHCMTHPNGKAAAKTRHECQSLASTTARCKRHNRSYRSRLALLAAFAAAFTDGLSNCQRVWGQVSGSEVTVVLMNGVKPSSAVQTFIAVRQVHQHCQRVVQSSRRRHRATHQSFCFGFVRAAAASFHWVVSDCPGV